MPSQIIECFDNKYPELRRKIECFVQREFKIIQVIGVPKDPYSSTRTTTRNIINILSDNL
jgi:hypothetical protein